MNDLFKFQKTIGNESCPWTSDEHRSWMIFTNDADMSLKTEAIRNEYLPTF